MKVCYLPGRESSYSRTRVILKGMKDAGIEVLDCSCRRRSFFRYIAGFWKFLLYKNRSDVIFVGFFGHFLVPVVKLFTGKKIIFDAFVSVYQTMVFDRKIFKPGGFFAKLARFIDRQSCKLADKVFLDTEQHIEYFAGEYNISRDKFCKLSASADDSVMYPRPDIEGEEFVVHFHGEFQALHGVKYIIEAASMLPDVEFRIIGRGKGFTPCEEMAKEFGLKNVKFIPPVSYEKLAEYICQSSICLGIFGNTQKAGLVIPNKVYEALACGKPVITSDTPAVRKLLTGGKNAVLCNPADPKDLAGSIERLKNDKNLREKIAGNGQRLFKEKSAPLVLGGEIAAVLSRFS